MSDWLFDLGNSRFKFAPLQDGHIGDIRAWPHEADLADRHDCEVLPHGETAWLASVASPAQTKAVVGALRPRFADVRFAHTVSRCAGVQIAYADPGKLGIDRFLALLAAFDHRHDALIVAVGTAMTIDLLDREGVHHGGRISASPTTMRQALHERAAQLPESGGQYREFADDTGDALASGCEGAAIALIERTLQQAQHRLGRTPGLLIHGGGADALLPELPQAQHRTKLVLEGLAIWIRHAAGTATA
ncbi:MAG: type III pantothenate kinase [Xanthomonadaceae bacterium]|jgi:type III pantothenate kinase|nr:type III pantothenate kinase [Xanthomonadaceae bacterium]